MNPDLMVSPITTSLGTWKGPTTPNWGPFRNTLKVLRWYYDHTIRMYVQSQVTLGCKALEAKGFMGWLKVKTHSYRGFTINMCFEKMPFVTGNGCGLHQLDTSNLHLRVMQ